MIGNIERIEKLKGIGEGKRAWIIGNGPSLRKAPLRLLHERSEHSFAVNRIASIYHETIWRPTYYSCTLQDITGRGDKIEFTLDILRAIKEAPLAFLAEWLKHQVGEPNNVVWLSLFKPHKTPMRDTTCHPYYSKDISRGVNMIRSLIVSIQIADYMGYSPIILLGVDGTYSRGHINNHFRKDYVAMSDLDYEWDVEGENAAQRQLHDIVKVSCPHVVNGTVGGAVEDYTRVDPFEVMGIERDRWREDW